MDRACIKVTPIGNHEDHVVADMNDLLGRRIGIGVTQACKTELVAIVGHNTRQVVQLAEGVLDQASTGSGLTRLR